MPPRLAVPLVLAACLAVPAAAPAASTVQGAPTFDAPIRLAAVGGQQALRVATGTRGGGRRRQPMA